MKQLLEKLSPYVLAHWQFALGGLLFYVGKDLLHSGHFASFLQDFSIGVIGFKAVSGVYTPAQLSK